MNMWQNQIHNKVLTRNLIIWFLRDNYNNVFPDIEAKTFIVHSPAGQKFLFSYWVYQVRSGYFIQRTVLQKLGLTFHEPGKLFPFSTIMRKYNICQFAIVHTLTAWVSRGIKENLFRDIIQEESFVNKIVVNFFQRPHFLDPPKEFLFLYAH